MTWPTCAFWIPNWNDFLEDGHPPLIGPSGHHVCLPILERLSCLAMHGAMKGGAMCRSAGTWIPILWVILADLQSPPPRILIGVPFHVATAVNLVVLGLSLTLLLLLIATFATGPLLLWVATLLLLWVATLLLLRVATLLLLRVATLLLRARLLITHG